MTFDLDAFVRGVSVQYPFLPSEVEKCTRLLLKLQGYDVYNVEVPLKKLLDSAAAMRVNPVALAKTVLDVAGVRYDLSRF